VINRTASILAVILFSSSFLCSCQRNLFSPAKSITDQAEELARNSQYKEAIELYQHHIQKRLAVKDRPDWENPYLYLLTIGDLELRQDNPTAALTQYEEAEKMAVNKELISDRYRSVAEYYENKNQLEAAVELLQKYRERDPLLFDGMLDRLSKRIVKEEDLATQ
jgi:tetratricopeptide (TPR) repeat protein